jgi:hypothetical protein
MPCRQCEEARARVLAAISSRFPIFRMRRTRGQEQLQRLGPEQGQPSARDRALRFSLDRDQDPEQVRRQDRERRRVRDREFVRRRSQQ